MVCYLDLHGFCKRGYLLLNGSFYDISTSSFSLFAAVGFQDVLDLFVSVCASLLGYQITISFVMIRHGYRCGGCVGPFSNALYQRNRLMCPKFTRDIFASY